MAGNPDWTGDIEVALSLPDVPPGNSRKIHESCGERVPELVRNTLQKMNRRQPELRLRMWPWPARCAPSGEPLPNLKVCREFFDRYKSAQLEVDPLQLISDLLLELRRERPVEWECCGWKNDAITDVVLGYTTGGYVENGSVTALRWLRKHWAHERSVDRQLALDSTEPRERALDAVLELQLLEMADELPRLQPKERYSVLARFVSWLSDNRNGCSSPQNAVGKFLLVAPTLKIDKGVLSELARVYDVCADRGLRERVLSPSEVIYEFVARRHKVSPRLVGRVRGDLNARP
jgi:hypothetical protein